MPLVVVCGIPGSGKTRRASALAQFLTQTHKCKVVLINEESIGIQKSEGYLGPNQQKITRGRIQFQVEKHLLGNTVVIADSLNYIKGFRYQMYCIARQQKTTYCVLYCNTPIEVARGFNEKAVQNNFTPELFEDIAKRMEAPQLKNRWDIPLFERREDESTPLEEMANTLLFEAKKSKDPVSTKTEEKLSEDYLYQVDRICQEVCDEACLGRIKMIQSWTPFQAKKVKTDFVGVIREKPIPLKAIRESYTHFLIEADKRR